MKETTKALRKFGIKIKINTPLPKISHKSSLSHLHRLQRYLIVFSIEYIILLSPVTNMETLRIILAYLTHFTHSGAVGSTDSDRAREWISTSCNYKRIAAIFWPRYLIGIICMEVIIWFHVPHYSKLLVVPLYFNKYKQCRRNISNKY